VKRFCVGFILAFTALFFSAAFLSPALLSPVSAANAAAQHGFSVKQYERFHDVLHPLEHEALPKKDFRRIRAKSALLVKRGNAIVKLGVPRGTSREQRPEFKAGLKEFSKALVKFRTDARKGTNEQLRVSYSAVHNSFEMLASLLPRR